MRPRATVFRFIRYRFDRQKKRAIFDYEIAFANRSPLRFQETLLLPKAPRRLDTKALARFLEPLHLILGISYYKLYCPATIEHPYALSKDQAVFWNTVYRKGLGEFLFRNNLDPKRIARFSYTKKSTLPVRIPVTDRLLVGIGGGKDSIVASELLKDFDTTSFLLETQRKDPISEEVMQVIGRPKLVLKRILDEQLFQEHDGAYNGHVPVSAVFAFVGLFTAALYGYRYIVVGNEHSSSFGNIEYKGESVNHQWSKSAEFEAMLQAYTRTYITPDITYFSLLRQFYEIRIAKLFAAQKKYFAVFSSCNRSFRVFKERSGKRWCGECAKCSFVFLMFAPFIKRTELVKIFKKDLLADAALVPMYEDLLGFGTMKPFDCVGTFEESRAALYLASKTYRDTAVVKALMPRIKDGERLAREVLMTVPAPTLPSPFRFLGIDSVALLGYAKEGKITERYLRKRYPKLKIGILDKTRDPRYLDHQGEYDLAVKTPGIPKEKVTIPYVTATNLFFAENKNFTIGITGSKGKSTTTSLVYAILCAAGKKARLLGNIGNPMLGALLEKRDPKEIDVIELSSYMLDDIEYSPNVAVLLNLFPEHMDYHGSIERYYAAKRNIFKFQKPGDIALTFPFTEKLPLKPEEIPLAGAHNLRNVQAAVAVARALKIPESAIKKGIRNFKPLSHRLELVGEYKGIRFYDDAISTTPESTMEALKALKGVDTIFLGGEDRGYDFSKLEQALKKANVRNVVLFPDTGSRMLKNKKAFNILETRSMEKAVAFAYKHTKTEKICLLSTASPSYSLWKNFEEKGNEFKKLAKKLSK